jgi:transcriptional regulator with XRE-family HTH domain
MSAKSLGKKIRQARKEMGLTQTDLAYRVGISTQSISAFESGRIRPDMKYVEKIAQFTHKPLFFFTGERVMVAINRVEKMIQELTELKEILLKVTDDESDETV